MGSRLADMGGFRGIGKLLQSETIFAIAGQICQQAFLLILIEIQFAPKAAATCLAGD